MSRVLEFHGKPIMMRNEIDKFETKEIQFTQLNLFYIFLVFFWSVSLELGFSWNQLSILFESEIALRSLNPICVEHCKYGNIQIW